MLTEHLEKKVFGSVVLNLEPASGEANGAHHAMVVLLVRLATFDPFFPFGPILSASSMMRASMGSVSIAKRCVSASGARAPASACSFALRNHSGIGAAGGIIEAKDNGLRIRT